MSDIIPTLKIIEKLFFRDLIFGMTTTLLSKSGSVKF